MPHRLFKIENAEDKKLLMTALKAIDENSQSLEASIPSINKLIEAHRYYSGVGLAANQIGIPAPIVVVEITEEQSLLREDSTPFPLHIFINPKYEGVEEGKKQEDVEACMSVDEIAGWVPRYKKIHFSAIQYDPITKKFENINGIYEGFLARVIQHETDHVWGITIAQRLTPDCKQGKPADIYRLRRSLLSPEKQALYDKLVAKQKKTIPSLKE